jgi:ribosomal protein S18 acetylase RimI-like enzyme
MLDNPIWNALSTAHAALAQGDGLARRYPPAVSPLAGLSEPSPAAYAALARVVPVDGMVAFFFDTPADPPPEWEVVHRDSLTQMVCRTPAPTAVDDRIESLGASDLAAMMELTALTEPGPFGPRTPELGRYFGIRVDGRLAAMAGERLRLTGYAEVSAVCTHPAHRGHGYAAALVSSVMAGMVAGGETPMLHVRTANVVAIRLYQRLGFTTRRLFHLAVVKRLDRR